MNQLVHEYLIGKGYAHEHLEAEWEDTGDAENGPDVYGHPEMDVYTGDKYVIVCIGEHYHIEQRDLALEDYAERMAAEFSQELPA